MNFSQNLYILNMEAESNKSLNWFSNPEELGFSEIYGSSCKKLKYLNKKENYYKV